VPFGLGFGETLLILAVILLFFGPKRLPEAAASLGKGIREFKHAMSGLGEQMSAAQANTIDAPPLPPHSTFAGPGADPNAVAVGAPEVEPVAIAATEHHADGEPMAAAPTAAVVA
jgi:sec-independent protein translocase protein TatB